MILHCAGRCERGGSPGYRRDDSRRLVDNSHICNGPICNDLGRSLYLLAIRALWGTGP